MATNYSLVCWCGKDGQTVTFTDAGDVVNLNYHGIRTGKPMKLVFTDNSGNTLPTGLSKNTAYWGVKGADIHKFILYPTEADALAGTNQTTFSGTGSGTHKVKSHYYYALSDKTRWTNGGTECIYNGVQSFNTGRAAASAYDTEICEIVGEWSEAVTGSSSFNLTVPAQSVLLTTMVNGARSTGFHNGTVGVDGFVLEGLQAGFVNVLTLSAYRKFADGFTVRSSASGGYSHVGISVGADSEARNMVAVSSTNLGIGIAITGVSARVINNLAKGWAFGFNAPQYIGSIIFANNTAVGNATYGFNAAATSNIRGFYYNNVALGNGTNWRSVSGFEGASNNAGGTGEAWMDAGGTRVEISEASPFSTTFEDYSNSDYRPKSGSALIDAGIVYYNPIATDLADDERPNYNNGGAEAYDIGCYEFDAGYGPHPTTQDYTVSGVTLGRIKIAKQSDGSEIYNDTTLPSAEPSTFSSSVPVYIYIRKGSSAPYYHPLKIAATIDVDAGLDYDATGLQQEDIAAHDYTGTAVASDWSFNLSTGAITHDSGTTRYSVQDLYSWHQDYTDGSTEIDDDPLMHGTTPTIFELINGGDISDADLQDLYGGSIEFEDGTLWTNIWTTDTMAAAHDVYLVQDGAKITDFWASGPIDVLVKVNDAGTLIDSGLIDVYARPYGYSYAYYQVDASAGGRSVAPISTLVDVPTTTISSATAATYSDVGFTFGSTSQDLGEGGGAGTYYCRIDCAGRTLDQVFARCQYVTRDVSTATLNSLEGWRYRKAHSSYTANDQYPFGRYAAGFWTVARGVWLDNVATSDQYSYQLTDHAGTTHQLMPPLNQSVALSGLDATWRVQLYDTDADEELYNDVPGATTLLWEDPLAPADDRPIRLRVMSTTNGDGSAIEMIDTAIGTCGTTAATVAISYLVAASEDTVDTANGIDGSTISGITINDGAMILEIDSGTVTAIGGVDVVQVDLKDLYAYETYWLGTEEGIRDEARFISAVDPANYDFVDFKLRNDTGYPVVIVGGYARDAATGSSASLTDYAGGAIHYAPDHVVNNVVTVGGANIITGDVADVLAAIPSADDVWSATTRTLTSGGGSSSMYVDVGGVLVPI